MLSSSYVYRDIAKLIYMCPLAPTARTHLSHEVRHLSLPWSMESSQVVAC